MNTRSAPDNPPLEWELRKASLDRLDEGGRPRLDEKYPPHDAPLYWPEFKAWVSANLQHLSLAIVDEQLIDPVARDCLQAFRAGRFGGS